MGDHLKGKNVAPDGTQRPGPAVLVFIAGQAQTVSPIKLFKVQITNKS